MEIDVLRGNIEQHEADAVIIYLFEGQGFEDSAPGDVAGSVDGPLNGGIRELVDAGDFTGKSGQVAVIYPRGGIPARRVIICGLGDPAAFSVDTARSAVALGLQKARDVKAGHVATVTVGIGAGGLELETSGRAIAEGALLGLYYYHGQKTSDIPESLPETLSILVQEEGDVAGVQQGVRIGTAIAQGANLARDLVNLPPNICTPSYLARAALQAAGEVGLRAEILEETQMRALKMGALLAVAQGSDAPPQFIVLEHNADKAADLETVVLIGKGVTFDTGGYNLKTFEGMGTMKADMAGAAAVIGAMRSIAQLDIPLHVVGIAPAVDNMISGHAYRPQEVVTASNGTTIEVVSTDAEGRMLLADALVYASHYKPSAVVDIATLTGACVVALGAVAAGLFATDDTLGDTLVAAGSLTGEKVWKLPLFPEYDKLIESDTADVKHTGGRAGGACSAAAFLKHFVDYPAWAHIDMAGMAIDSKDKPYVPAKGASGYGARLLTEFVRRWANRD